MDKKIKVNIPDEIDKNALNMDELEVVSGGKKITPEMLKQMKGMKHGYFAMQDSDGDDELGGCVFIPFKEK